LADQQRLLREVFAAHRGEVIDTQGDSFFVAFRGAADAVAAAVAIQRALAGHRWPDGADVRVRIGIHTGEASATEERYLGLSVHRAARVGGAAHGGQVLVSDSTRSLVEDDLPAGVFLRDLGSHRLKDIDRPERISQLVAEGLRLEFPPLRGAEPVKAPPLLRRRSVLAATLAGVIAAAVAIPVFALSSGSGGGVALAGVGVDSVGVIDASTGRITASVPVESGPSSIAVGAGSIWTANTNADTVSRIEPKTSAVVQTIPVGHAPSGVAIGDGFVWVANSLDGTVSRIDPRVSGGRVVGDAIPVGNSPSSIAFGQGHVWVANSGDRTIVRIDPGSGDVGQPISVPAGADAIAVGDGAVWVASESEGSVSRIDPRTGRVIQSINVGNGPSAIAIGPGAVWVLNTLEGTVSRIDPASNEERAKFAVGNGPSGIAVSQDGKSVWVSEPRDGALSLIDPARNAVDKSKTIQTGNRPAGVALSSGTLYVTVRASNLSHRGGTLTIATTSNGSPSGSEAGDIDPAHGYGRWWLLTATNDGLLTYGHGGATEGNQLVADLARSVPTPSDGGKTFTFQLRSGIRYSNGALVRPADFRRGIERALATNGESPPGAYFRDIVGSDACTKKRCDLSKGIETDPVSNAVTFHLTAPDPDFLYKLALPTTAAVPADTPLKAQLPLPATGPYMIASYDPKHGIRLVRNPRFHEWSAAAQPNGYPDQIVEKWGYTSKTAARAVEQGKADLTSFDNTVPPALLTELSGRFNGQLHENPTLATGFIVLNTRVAPFNDVRVRRAVNFAVNRNRWVALRSAHLFRPSCQVLPPNVPGYRPYCPYTIHPGFGRYNGPDLAKAKKLVAASGTRGRSISILLARDAFSPPALNYFVSVLNELGYRARLDVVDGSVYSLAGDSRRKVQAMGSLWYADYPLASNFFLPLLSCRSYVPRTANNGNWAEFCNRRIDTLMARAQAKQTTDPQGAAALWAQVDREIVDQAPFVVIFTPQELQFTSTRARNYVYSSAGGALLDQLWVR
jgi:YVTN family beta-propeller protein